jgi:F-type H+-transporting ATPase subunit delta
VSDMNVARRYARALFQLADERKNLKQVFTDLKDLRSILESSSDLQSFILNPVLTLEDQQMVVKSVFEGRAQPLVMTFLLFLIEKSRLKILHDILDAFIEIYLESTNTLTAAISAERALDPARLDLLVSKLQERTNKNVTADVTIDEQLLGGFKVRIGDQVYDASLAAQLKRYHHDVLSTV